MGDAMNNQRLSSENGQGLLIFTMMIATLCGVVALTVDIGLGFLDKARIQNAADSAALAGIQLLPDDPDGAVDAATEIANAYGLSAEDGLDIQLTTTYYPNDTISVSASHDETAQFAAVMGIDFFEVSASAKARVGSPSGLDRFIPFSVLESSLAGLTTGDVTDLHYDSQDASHGNSLALSFPGVTGASGYSTAIVNGSPFAYCVAGQEYEGCSSTISTEPGQMVGALKQGIDIRFDATSVNCDTFAEVISPDPETPGNSIINPECHPYAPYNVTDSRRITLIPMISNLCAGRCDVQITGFALLFLNDIDCTGGSCQLTGTYIERVSNFRDYIIGPYQPSAPFLARKLIE
ncbi:MAG TPA: pilus assembly protein TadG-related protein [Dehalococcoidia bacterium]